MKTDSLSGAAACAARLLTNKKKKLPVLMKNHLSGRADFRYAAQGWVAAAPLGGGVGWGG